MSLFVPVPLFNNNNNNNNNNIPILPQIHTQNPCTKSLEYERSEYQQEKARFKEIVTRKMVNKITKSRKKFKSPLEIAGEFDEIDKILRSDAVSLKKKKENLSQLRAMLNPLNALNETININHNQMNQMNQMETKNENKVKNIKYEMSEQSWHKLWNKFNYSRYCANNNIKLQSNDEHYYFNEANDYKLIQKLKKNKCPIIKQCNLSKIKTNKLFKNILNENGDGQFNQLSNYKFLRHKFPCLTCMDCGGKLMVIPLSYIGNGYINYNNENNYMVRLYKICAICCNYPNCEFPLYRSTYLKYWIRSAYFDLQKRTTKRKRKRNQILIQETNNNNNNKVKKRKLNNNSYNYLQSLSTMPTI